MKREEELEMLLYETVAHAQRLLDEEVEKSDSLGDALREALDLLTTVQDEIKFYASEAGLRPDSVISKRIQIFVEQYRERSK